MARRRADLCAGRIRSVRRALVPLAAPHSRARVVGTLDASSAAHSFARQTADVIAAATRGVLRGVGAPAALALIVGVCTIALVEHGQDQRAQERLERRADVVEAAL